MQFIENKSLARSLRLARQAFSRAGATLALLFTLILCAAASAAPFPAPTGYVNDFAGVVDPASKQQAENICRELQAKTGAQIAVAVFKSMDGGEIDDFANRLFSQWHPGKKEQNNGILIVDAVEERRVRIEVGYGLEPIINDAMAGRIRRDIMTPLLQEGKRGEAYLAGVAALAAIIAQDQKVTLESLQGVQVRVPRESRSHRRNPPYMPLVMLLGGIAWFAIMAANRRRGGGNRWGGGGGPWIGGGGFGGGGWGGGGGGGFGGFGGGMSGGGGSSGGY